VECGQHQAPLAPLLVSFGIQQSRPEKPKKACPFSSSSLDHAPAAAHQQLLDKRWILYQDNELAPDLNIIEIAGTRAELAEELERPVPPAKELQQ